MNEKYNEILYPSAVDEPNGTTPRQVELEEDRSDREGPETSQLRLVSIGGGTGQPIVLKGLKGYLFSDSRGSGGEASSRERLTAVVTMTDDGGSSGRLREELDVLPPGDIRNCLIGLSENESLMTQLFKFRFGGEHCLSGHNLGNLILTALSDLHQSFLKAVTDLSSVLAIRGQILPATTDYTILCAELADGSIIEGETKINACKTPIRRVMLKPEDVRPPKEVLSALQQADGIIIGPGSLYTSILPNLLINGVAEAIQESSAVTVLVTNLMTEPEETRGYSVSDHLRIVEEHMGFQIIDHALINTAPLPGGLSSKYKRSGAELTHFDPEKIYATGVNPVQADLLAYDSKKVRHDPDKLARSILRLFRQQGFCGQNPIVKP